MRTEKILYLTTQELYTVTQAEKFTKNLVNTISDDEVIGEDITRDDIEVMINILNEIWNICKLDTEEVKFYDD